MNLDPVYAEVVKALSHTLMIDASKITPTARLVEELDVTSLDLLTVAMDIEKKYGQDLFEDDTKGLTTVADLVEYVRSHLQVAGISP